MPLSPTAKKEVQIEFINKLEKTVNALIEFAQGNEAPLAALFNTPTPLVPTTDGAVADAFQQPHIETGIALVPPKSSIPDADKCHCAMAVKDKSSSTQLCLACGKNAYENHYVFSHTDEGKELLAQYKLKDHPVLPGVVLMALPADAAFGQWPITDLEDEAVYGEEAS
jgi:hypothetical protein